MRNSIRTLAFFALTLAAGLAVAARPLSHDTRQERPIPLGVSGGNAEGPCFAGTLGCLVKDASGNLYILSNHHVFTRDTNTWTAGDRVTQPGKLDNGCRLVAADVVGTVSQVKAIDFSGTNLMDAALAAVATDAVKSDGTILGIGSPDPTVVAAMPGQSVRKAGRTTGVTKGSVSYTGVTINVDYGNGDVATFTEQIAIGGGFSQAGDSGSLIVDSSLRPVALLFAGGGGYTFANPIGHVLDEFGVEIVGAGSSGGGGSGGGKGGGGKAKPKAAQALERHGPKLLATSGVAGHGLGRKAGRDVLVVFLEKDDAATRAKLPKTLDGFDVEVVVTGKVTPY